MTNWIDDECARIWNEAKEAHTGGQEVINPWRYDDDEALPYNEQDPKRPALLEGRIGQVVLGTAALLLLIAALVLFLLL